MATYQSPWMNEELQLFRATLRKFIQNEFLPQQARWCHQRSPDTEAWRAAGAMGMLLPDVPETYGGGGGSFAHECVVIEELAQAGINFGTANQSIVARYLLKYGSEEQKRRWLPAMARGEMVGAIAMTEPSAGSDVQAIKTSARRVGDRYVINGAKTFISNGLLAGLVCLAVKTDATVPAIKGISLLLVETANLAGYRVGHPLEKVGMHEHDTCELFFDEVSVPVAHLLGGVEGRGFSQMMEQLPCERLTIGVNAVTTAERAVAITSRYVQERMVFGKPLLDFQNTRFKLAECRTEAHIGRVFIDNCIERYMAGQLDDTTTAMAKYWLTECQCRVVDECLQLHGGYGYMMEYPIARMWADSRVQRIYAGSNEIMKEIIGWSL
ncbi:Acyl-CoA dehydrogenase [Georgfuchsia toluolica]|uniref:Acyl-[acyl-carrier-protein] dehydrogenase MbtN n=1 Tax=Georgfuchsia toluolica TaxID=424218 RepID=A0A916J2S6_9PROT|nr:acyl-CoA dehydrogenase family protein [Georgfuchsia toluolica]CAG4882931.1 Acyl-CoA dehydrogenase [Georgfuchsia toluolica]